MVQEKYGVQLSTQEKGRLRQMIRAGRSSAQAITRARILLKTDEAGLLLKWPQPWTSRSGPCSAPSGGTPRRGWMRCCGTATKSAATGS